MLCCSTDDVGYHTHGYEVYSQKGYMPVVVEGYIGTMRAVNDASKGYRRVDIVFPYCTIYSTTAWTGAKLVRYNSV